ncbi:MAG: hypothetical protein GX112_03185 [Clostridiaceae bacterium]|nr:hypothetical protein [Clostridiaceae bacterium]
MNTTLQAISNRRSIRSFAAAPLKQEEIDALIVAALASPTAMNRQLWEFRFITSQSLIEAMNEAALSHFRSIGDQAALDRIAARHASIFYGAPLLVVIAIPADAGRYAAIDAGIAVENLAIAAQSLGLGSCIIGMASASFTGARGKAILEQMDWPEGYEFAISIAIGHPAMSKEAHERHPEKVRQLR